MEHIRRYTTILNKPPEQKTNEEVIYIAIIFACTCLFFIACELFYQIRTNGQRAKDVDKKLDDLGTKLEVMRMEIRILKEQATIFDTRLDMLVKKGVNVGVMVVTQEGGSLDVTVLSGGYGVTCDYHVIEWWNRDSCWRKLMDAGNSEACVSIIASTQLRVADGSRFVGEEDAWAA
jgi:hypothetical protein